jgi:large subunit ribosomal protein L6
MSRIGKLPISIPQGVEISVDGNKVTVKGKEGVLTQEVNPSIKINYDKDKAEMTFTIDEEYDPINVSLKQKQAYHGLYRALIHNMVVGVSQGYEKQMELVGVGYRVSNKGNLVEFALGYTHSIFLQLPDEIKVETKAERNQNPQIILRSCDKQLLGQVCAKIRSFRKPEPYKGKGILFVGEQIRRKSGKSAGAK